MAERTITVPIETISVYQGPPIRQEDPSKWHPPLMKDTDVQKRYGGVSMDALLTDWPTAFQFPRPLRKREFSRLGSWKKTYRYEWAADNLTEWEATIRALAALLPKK